MHHFPKKNNLRRKWVKFVQTKRADFTQPSDHSVICSDHFTPESYAKSYMKEMRMKQRQTLVPGAVPTLQSQPKTGGAGSSTLKRCGEPEAVAPRGAGKRRRAAAKLEVNRVRILAKRNVMNHCDIFTMSWIYSFSRTMLQLLREHEQAAEPEDINFP